MHSELDILGTVSDRLEQQGIPFMLTGSYALAYYATPRMTRDLDLVVALKASEVEKLLTAFTADFYLDADAVREAVRTSRQFNMMHLASGIKVDMIVGPRIHVVGQSGGSDPVEAGMVARLKLRDAVA